MSKSIDARKLALMRRADSERDGKGFSISGNVKRSVFASADRKPSLPKLKCLEAREDEERA